IPSFGLSTTNWIAAATNISLAVSVCLLGQFGWNSPVTLDDSTATEAKDDSLSKTGASDESKKLSFRALSIMFAFGISGAIAMVYEVSWTRVLLLVIGSTTYAFSIMLSTFLLGIFLGSLCTARISDRLKDAVLWFSVLQVCIGAS